ncbi:efflux RND transporter periplasmic adaptor subunit [Desulfovibrio falkowii]|uniref:RND efflux pump membrane fusion protein barrel-sandwich domain-containing protein n=1 Tax=Desulfovibrio falkowii TaxID=3136602 RepID=A0ABQ0E790_9BACT
MYFAICCALISIFINPLGAFCSESENNLNFVGKVISRTERTITRPYPYIVDKVLVQSGETVKEGDILLQYRLEPAERKYFQNEIFNEYGCLDLQNHVAALEQEKIGALRSMQRNKELADAALGSSEEKSKAQLNLSAVSQRLTNAQKKLERADIVFQLYLAELSKYFGIPLKKGSVLPETFVLRAPMDGNVVRLDASVRPSGLISAGVPAVVIGVLDPMQAQILVHESEVESIHIGDSATIELVNDKSKKYTAKVVEISWKAQNLDVAAPSFYYVYFDISNSDYTLRPGFKVRANMD